MQWDKDSTEIPDFFSIVQPRIDYFSGKISKVTSDIFDVVLG